MPRHLISDAHYQPWLTIYNVKKFQNVTMTKTQYVTRSAQKREVPALALRRLSTRRVARPAGDSLLSAALLTARTGTVFWGKHVRAVALPPSNSRETEENIRRGCVWGDFSGRGRPARTTFPSDLRGSELPGKQVLARRPVRPGLVWL
jgi:hypothetical protein